MEELKNIILNCHRAEKEYYEAKNNRKNRENELILNTDWNKINQSRVDKGLSKISNQASRDAYISEELKDLRILENKKLACWNMRKMFYEHYEELVQLGGK